jgi:hypothetical protein
VGFGHKKKGPLGRPSFRKPASSRLVERSFT